MFTHGIVAEMNTAKYGNRSYTKQVLSIIKERQLQQEVAEITIEVIAFGIYNGIPLTAICRKIANRLYRLLEIENERNDRMTIRLGADCIDWAARAGLVSAQKYSVIENDGKPQYFLEVSDEYFGTYIRENSTGALKANNGVAHWTGPVLKVGEHRLDIVKSARRYGLLSNYRYSEMPEVYSALNRLNDTCWGVNKDLLLAISASLTASNPILPSRIGTDEKKAALREINKVERVALWLSEIKFKELVELGYDDEAAEAIAEQDINSYKITKSFDHLEVISKWSKREDFERCVRLATEYGDDVLNFIYNCDSRGRVYALQHGLNPQGADFAKALLVFANPKPVSTWDFYVSIANHAGQDKKSYEDRVAWVETNVDNIYMVGSDPFSEESIKWLIESGINREDKSKFQFIASAMEFVKLNDFISNGGNQDEFLCSVPVGYDATNSGLQILSGIGRDEKVAPLVNITNTPKPGDVYQYVGGFVADKKPLEKLEVFERDAKIWRKICKRNVMTKCYAATRIGMGDQQWEDRKSYGHEVTDGMTVKECRQLGAVVYDTCSEHLLKASELMECMKGTIKTINSSIVTWKMPTGFTAFQVKDKSKYEQVDVRIGELERISLGFYTFTDNPNKAKHASAIAPDMVHSIDAWLLIEVVNDLPADANLAFVHDQFGSDSCHGQDVQESARSAFHICTSRTVFKALLGQVAGEPVELPEEGSWDPKDAYSADYMFS